MSAKHSAKNFSGDGVYSCPVCRHGEISAMPLMDTLACNFCRHIFTFDHNQQSLTMADSASPLSWRWNGRGWRGAHRDGEELSWGVALAAIALVLLPTTIVGLSAYIFPPMPGSLLSWLPTFWIGLTFLAHCAFVVSLIVEYYQFPIFAYLQAMKRSILPQ